MMPSFTNEEIDIHKLPQYEELSLQPLAKHYRNVIMLNITLVCIICISISGFLIWNDPDISNYALVIGIAHIIFWPTLFRIYAISFRKRGYAVRSKDIIYKSGIIAEKITIVPFSRIQHMAIEEGLFSRYFGLATLQIHTAGGHTGNMNIPGIPLSLANTLKEEILQKVDTLKAPATHD